MAEIAAAPPDGQGSRRLSGLSRLGIAWTGCRSTGSTGIVAESHYASRPPSSLWRLSPFAFSADSDVGWQRGVEAVGGAGGVSHICGRTSSPLPVKHMSLNAEVHVCPVTVGWNAVHAELSSERAAPKILLTQQLRCSTPGPSAEGVRRVSTSLRCRSQHAEATKAASRCQHRTQV